MPIPGDGVPFDISVDLEKSHARVALGVLFERSDCSGRVQLQTQPFKSVICTDGAKAREIRLVPLSNIIFQADLAKSNPVANAATIETPLTDPRTGERVLIGVSQPKMVLPTAKKTHETPFVVPYWFVRSSGDLAEKNMDIMHVKVSVSAALQGDDGARKRTLSIPVLTNIVPLKPNSELVMYKAQMRDSAEALPAAPPTKRHRRHLPCYLDAPPTKRAKGGKGTGGKGTGTGKPKR